jgi:ubiquinol-cytochrome c reductase cytochrome c1 subunit
MFERPARPSDHFVPPFPNPQAARAANNGALPPDLSLIVKARKGGADYIYGLLTGFTEPPAGLQIAEGMNYNKVFPGHQIAMPPPLSEGAVTYADGTPATVEQMAHDVATFLAWTAEPELDARKRMGVKTILFLIVLTGMLYAVKRKVWAEVH